MVVFVFVFVFVFMLVLEQSCRRGVPGDMQWGPVPPPLRGRDIWIFWCPTSECECGCEFLAGERRSTDILITSTLWRAVGLTQDRSLGLGLDWIE